MIQLGLTGYPLEHSLSPVLHEAALRAAGMEGNYSLFPIQPGDVEALGKLVKRLRTGELGGLNVTIPYKQAIMPYLDALTPPASAIGAVNTIYSRNGKLVGDNTDAPGFLTDLDRILPAPASALVLGAGGAARAVVYALRSRGCIVSIAARNVEQARQLAVQFPGVHPLKLDADAMADVNADLIVNASPAGMFPQIEGCPWPAGLAFPQAAVIYDLVYNPPETRLVKSAKAAGLRATSGLGMLIEQAALAFELWTGCNFRRELLSDAIRQSAR